MKDGTCHLVTGITEYGKEPKRITVSNQDGNFLVSDSTVYDTVPADEKSAESCCGIMGEAGNYGEWDVVASSPETETEKLKRLLAENKAKQSYLRDEEQTLERISKSQHRPDCTDDHTMRYKRELCKTIGC